MRGRAGLRCFLLLPATDLFKQFSRPFLPLRQLLGREVARDYVSVVSSVCVTASGGNGEPCVRFNVVLWHAFAFGVHHT